MKPKNRCEKKVANRKTAYVFTPVPQTAGHSRNRKTEGKLRKNRKTAHKKVPKPQNRKQVDPPLYYMIACL